jgi:hypothetical protein
MPELVPELAPPARLDAHGRCPGRLHPYHRDRTDEHWPPPPGHRAQRRAFVDLRMARGAHSRGGCGPQP